MLGIQNLRIFRLKIIIGMFQKFMVSNDPIDPRLRGSCGYLKRLYLNPDLFKKQWFQVHDIENELYRVLHIFSSPLELICALTGQSYVHFQTLSQCSCFRALKRGIWIFQRLSGSKMAGRQSLKCKNEIHFIAIYLMKWMFFRCPFCNSIFDNLQFVS